MFGCGPGRAHAASAPGQYRRSCGVFQTAHGWGIIAWSGLHQYLVSLNVSPALLGLLIFFVFTRSTNRTRWPWALPLPSFFLSCSMARFACAC